MWNITQIPEIRTERLVLNEITEKDIDDYNEIVLDSQRNRWWGYDDVGNLGEDVRYDSFYNIAHEDFINHEAVNFAVRLEGKMIGEVVLYDFDRTEKGELGCRISKKYKGNGYGIEAFNAVLEWALNDNFLKTVVAKCFKENNSSYRMLDTTMTKIGEDNTYFYFKRNLGGKTHGKEESK